MRNDRKGAPARNLVGQGTHQSASAVSGMAAVAGKPPALRWRRPLDMMAEQVFANCHTSQSTTEKRANRYRSSHLQQICS
jgi:hypothetical protein